jgi:hypothetical protein
VAEDRLVLPIPPDTHWRDAKPIVLPGMTVEAPKPLTLPGGAAVRTRPELPKISQSEKLAVFRSQSKHLKGCPPGKAAVFTGSGVKYVDRADYVPPEPAEAKPKKPRKPRQKHDPKMVSAARELRDRYLDQVNSGMLLPPANGKYDVSRQLEAGQSPGSELKRLPAANLSNAA